MKLNPPSASRPGDSPGLLASLGEIDRAVDQVLGEIRARSDTARRSVTRELGLEPSPGMLRSIIRIAADPATSGPRRTIPRSLLALHVLVARELGDLLESPRPNAKRLKQGGRQLESLLRSVRAIENELRETLGTIDEADRAFLVEIADAMPLPEGHLIAATVLTPRLQLLIEAPATGDLRGLVPSLTAEEEELLARASSLDPDVTPGCRASVNAVVLRTLIEEDLDRLASLDRRPDLSAADPSRSAVIERLRRDIVAYQVVHERLRDQQDAAIDAGLERFAAEIGRVKSGLFIAQLKLLPALRRAT